LRGGFGPWIHGEHLPTAAHGIGSIGSVFIMKGPGIKESHRIESVRWLTDIAPTISYLLDIPTPRNAEGAIMLDLLEDPDGRLGEKKLLMEELESWKNAYGKMRSITHSS